MAPRKKIEHKPTFVAVLLYLVKRFLGPIVILVITLWSWGFYALGEHAVYSAHPELAIQEQQKKLLQEVGQVIALPDGTPTIVTITDAATAKQAQPFLANAKNGDVLIIYANVAEPEAILYRPSTNRIITVGPAAPGTPTKSGSNNLKAASASIPAIVTTSTATTSDDHATTTK